MCLLASVAGFSEITVLSFSFVQHRETSMSFKTMDDGQVSLYAVSFLNLEFLVTAIVYLNGSFTVYMFLELC